MTSSQPQPIFGLEWSHRGQKGQLPGGGKLGAALVTAASCCGSVALPPTCSGPPQLAWQRQTLTYRMPGGEFCPPGSLGRYQRLRGEAREFHFKQAGLGSMQSGWIFYLGRTSSHISILPAHGIGLVPKRCSRSICCLNE